ncbi:hypothetical protein HC251_07690 [Iamia sp. SCSIO 61187]|uniref:hypothetical protein n=1 Tax=Iamia sp. SCSIO 61187 TaxID=2722752 RepID=UPI001C62AE55|nr:hypothetical protein [Iamia sp. SCSIO 61187]QYG92333.1 hypothetical protein HC251_07690 [Iamia sp. SCSIO 61187]
MTTPTRPPGRTTHHTALRWAARLVLGCAVVTVVFAGCGDDEDDDATDAETTTELEASTTTEGPPEGAAAEDAGSGPSEEGPVVEVRLVDYSFLDLPERVPAGTRLTITNDSAAELHELVAFRIPDDETRPVEELVTLPEEEIGAIFGEGPPATVLLAPPGGEQIDAVGDGTLAEPGRYAVVCFIPTGVDPDAYLNAPPSEEGPPEIPGAGPPHLTHGMHAGMIVE